MWPENYEAAGRKIFYKHFVSRVKFCGLCGLWGLGFGVIFDGVELGLFEW